MRVRTRLTAGVLAAAVAVTLVSCSDSDDPDSSGLETVPPATAEQSPTGTPAPIGVVVDQNAGRALAVAGSSVAVLGDDGRTLTLHTAPGAADAPVPRVVDLPTDGVVDVIADGGGFLAVAPAGLVSIAADGAVSLVDAEIDAPTTLAVDGDMVLVGTAGGDVLVMDRDGSTVREIGGFAGVDQILVAPDSADGVAGQVTVVDRAQSAVWPIDVESGERKAALRAGNGVTNAVVDRFGRILAAGTRDDEVYAFYGAPIVMRLRAPAPDSPYAIAYDDDRDLLWVSSTVDNTAVAYDISRGDARERLRVPTVGQVTAMTVDPGTGSLLVLSGRGDGLQVIAPADTAN